MKGIYEVLNGVWGGHVFRVSGALPEGFINSAVNLGTEMLAVKRLDAFTLEVCVPGRDRAKLEKAAAKSGCSIAPAGKRGSAAFLPLLRRRIVPAALIFLLLGGVFLSRLFIWDIEISGNENVSDGKILAALSRCGVESGTYWPALTADLVRSEALLLLPELSWLTVNVYGSRAEVLVREKTEKPDMVYLGEASDIVAEKDGFVESVLALEGTAMIQRGSAVSRGQTLISGGVKSSFSPPRFLKALGSVAAQTYYEICVKIPASETVKSYTGEKKSRWSIIIGGERLNFYGNSSISECFCDKIYSVWELGAKGLFRLPISIRRETLVFYETEESERDKALARAEAESYLRSRLREAIGAEGQVISEHFSASESGGVISVCLRAVCREEIGVSVPMSEGEIQKIKNDYNSKGEETND